jgi:hypothetical protein
LFHASILREKPFIGKLIGSFLLKEYLFDFVVSSNHGLYLKCLFISHIDKFITIRRSTVLHQSVIKHYIIRMQPHIHNEASLYQGRIDDIFEMDETLIKVRDFD